MELNRVGVGKDRTRVGVGVGKDRTRVGVGVGKDRTRVGVGVEIQKIGVEQKGVGVDI